jgi:transcriptional regulator with XRE-family HTH domain
MAATSTSVRADPARGQVQDVDRLVGDRMRLRRLMQGITQQQLADLVGVTYQQVHKYEVGLNRITAGRLHQVAKVLDVEVAFFFEGSHEDSSFVPTPRQYLLLQIAQSFLALPDRRYQIAICDLARALASDGSKVPT